MDERKQRVVVEELWPYLPVKSRKELIYTGKLLRSIVEQFYSVSELGKVTYKALSPPLKLPSVTKAETASASDVK